MTPLLGCRLSVAPRFHLEPDWAARLAVGTGVREADGRFFPRGPWRAVGKVQTGTANLHESCTGALIGPALVLTAAHCVFNPQTQRNFAPQSLHFLVGYNGEDYAGHATGVGLVTGPGYDPLHPEQTQGSDWALLTIDSKLGTPDRVLALRDAPN